MVFCNGSNFDYQFIIKELAKEFEGEFSCLGENTEKCKTFSEPVTKELKRIDKNEEEIAKTISYKLQFVDLWQAHYQFFLIILPREFIIIKKCENVWNLEYKCLYCNENYQKNFDENLTDLLIHKNSRAMISMNLFCYCEKVFTHMNTWMIGKNSMKHHYLKKKKGVCKDFVINI